ncbi:MAG: AbrB/MazE/SpoVT family DNA-binding domain-containing protein [Mesorhizobium sp.]
MDSARMLIVTVSSKGQVIIPRVVRERREWRNGTRLTVEETEDGVLLKSAPAFPETRSEDVFGVLPYSGKAKTVAQMDAGVLAAARSGAITRSGRRIR